MNQNWAQFRHILIILIGPEISLNSGLLIFL